MRSTLIIYTDHCVWFYIYMYLSSQMEGRSCLTQGRLAIRTKHRGGRGVEAISHWAESMSFVSVLRSRDSWWITLIQPGLTSPRNTWSICHTISQFFIHIFVYFLLREVLFYCLQTSLSELLLLSAMLRKSFACYLDWWWTFQQE